ncbi:MAG: hypothetical protein QNK05_13660 [Myxococcota bacterium]|nr:hypothetical protein [Myxococcota bacterium]
MSARGAHVGVGLYFIDVLACLLFSLALVLTSARFGRVHAVEVVLPESGGPGELGAELPAVAITLRKEGSDTRLYLEDEPIAFEALARRLSEAPPAAVVLRSEATPLARVIAAAHEAGIEEIGMAVSEKKHAPGEVR